MNINTFARHGVFTDPKLVRTIAAKLSSKEEIARAKLFPYQLLMAYLNTEDAPNEIRNALQEAMEFAVDNVPSLNGRNVKIAVDTSGSMGSPVTGRRGSVTSKARCIDVASLIASALLRKNKGAKLYPFDTSVHSARDINAFDSVMTNAVKLAKFGGGGTDCSSAMTAILKDAKNGDVADVVVFVSDNESWYDDFGGGRATGVAVAWEQLRRINPKAKMICIDLIGNDTTQIVDGKGVLNVGGFSDQIFEEISRFVEEVNPNSWVEEIEKIEI
jgi:60 kDa SS-A/Ro ribonucleoprotein